MHLLTRDVLDRTKHVRFSDQVNKRKFSTFAALTGVFALALIVGLYVATLFFPIGSPKILALNLRKPNADAIELKVTPGDQTVAKGDNITIQAVAMAFDPQRATIHLRYANGTEWETSTMEVTPQNLPTFRHLIFNIQEAVHYFVDAGGYRSKEFTLDVADLPRRIAEWKLSDRRAGRQRRDTRIHGRGIAIGCDAGGRHGLVLVPRAIDLHRDRGAFDQNEYG